MTTTNSIKMSNDKIAIISDTHLGIHSDSDLWHEIIITYATWLRDDLIKKDIKDIFILGDIFNNREEVGVKTLHVAEEFFRILKDFNITILIGNHDCFLRDSSNISSVSIFKGWSNINVIDTMTTIDVLDNKLCLCPWGTDYNNVPQGTNIIFGHLEINTFKRNAFKLCDSGLDSDFLLERAKLIISGHFHLRDVRHYTNGDILYVGCPYPQTWNDADAVKGYYVLDFKTLTYEFTENTVSPKFYKIKMSDMFIKDKLPNLKQQIVGNFIKLIVDIKIEYAQFEKIMNTLLLLKPIELSSDFTGETTIKPTDTLVAVSLDIKTTLSDLISTLDVKDLKQKIEKELELLYNSALNKVKIEVT